MGLEALKRTRAVAAGDASVTTPGWGDAEPSAHGLIETARKQYTEVAHIQLRAVINALAEQLDRLGQAPHFGARPPSGTGNQQGE